MNKKIMFLGVCLVYLTLSSNLCAQPIALPSEDELVKETAQKRGIEGKDFFKKGVEAYNNKKYSEAMKNFEKVLFSSPEDFEASYYLGMIYTKQRDLDKAIENFQNSTNIYPNEMILISMTILVNIDKDYRSNIEEKIKMYQNKIKNNQANYKIYNNLGYLSFLFGGDEKYEAYYLKSIELKPDFAQPKYNLALYYLLSNKKELAQEQYNKLKIINSKMANTIKKIIDSSERR